MRNSCFLVKYNRICKFWLSLNGWVAHGVAASHVGYLDGSSTPNRSKRGPMKSDVKCPCVRESVNEGPRSCRDEGPVGSCHKVGSSPSCDLVYHRGRPHCHPRPSLHSRQPHLYFVLAIVHRHMYPLRLDSCIDPSRSFSCIDDSYVAISSRDSISFGILRLRSLEDG